MFIVYRPVVDVLIDIGDQWYTYLPSSLHTRNLLYFCRNIAVLTYIYQLYALIDALFTH